MDEDESITMLMAMGFDNLDDIRRALRMAKARSSSKSQIDRRTWFLQSFMLYFLRIAE